MLTAEKTPLKSLTITSSGVAAIASFLDVVGVHIGNTVTAADLNSIIAGGCAIVAIYGRIRATKTITPTAR